MPMMVSVLVLGASMLALQAAKQTRRPLAEQRTTEQRLDRIEKALKAYWVTHSCNELPSPATVALGSTVVPLRELGLQSDDALDAWGRLITYRYDPPCLGGAIPKQQRWIFTSCLFLRHPILPPPLILITLMTSSGSVWLLNGH